VVKQNSIIIDSNDAADSNLNSGRQLSESQPRRRTAKPSAKSRSVSDRPAVDIPRLSSSGHADISSSPHGIESPFWTDRRSSSSEPEEFEELPTEEYNTRNPFPPMVEVEDNLPIFVDPADLSPIAVSPDLSPTTSIALSNWSIGSKVPLGLSLSDQVSATSFFFRNYIVRDRHPDSSRGFFEILHDFYNSAGSSSLLHQATHAVSLASYSNYHKSEALRAEGRKTYGKALQRLNSSIQDPKVVSSDETLMSVLLFAFYEQVTYHASTKTIWTRHVNGAAAIVGMRGQSQFDSPQSLQLFRAVRTLMVRFFWFAEKLMMRD
jgi:hypothetical protein